MEAIRRIVSEIIFLCRNKDMPVSDTLAAFVAHSLVLERADLFPLDKELSEGDVQTLVRMTVERLLTTDSPSLETIKMQVAFDSAKLEEVDVLDRQRNSREAREAVMLRDIIDVRLKGANDVPALTALYKRIFNFLVLRAALDPGVNRPAEREIAAALESVFPRIGLKAFTLLAPEDKAAQLHELANIVLGIRLYNRSIGKGGAGIDDLPALARAAVQELARACGGALENIDKLAAEYGEVMSYRHSAVRMRAVGALTAAEQADDAAKTQRLHDELANRRQYGAYTATLFDGLQTSSKHLAEIERLQEKEMEVLSQVVGARASVPKEQVYPRFDALAKLWLAFEDELQMLAVRKATIGALRAFEASYARALKSEDVSAARAARRAAAAAGEADANGFFGHVVLSAAELRAAAAAAAAAASAGPGGGGAAAAAETGVAERVAADSAPSMLALALEVEGICPVTLVAKSGLLLPGSAACIVRYNNRYYSCVDEASANAFVQSPIMYVQGLINAARRRPELIQLLRLAEYFPGASIPEMTRAARARNARGGGSLAGDLVDEAPRQVQDAQMQTQTHLVDKHIDPSYEFSEWALRRRALQLANLRHKATKSQQTAASHFRKEITTQVYLPREGGTQTAVTTGTEAPRMVNYIKGLRGHPDSEMHIVNLTIDPGATRGVTVGRDRR